MRRAVSISGVSAMIGTRGRSRATSETVVPDCDRHSTMFVQK
jgi:hypothetical protein